MALSLVDQRLVALQELSCQALEILGNKVLKDKLALEKLQEVIDCVNSLAVDVAGSSDADALLHFTKSIRGGLGSSSCGNDFLGVLETSGKDFDRNLFLAGSTMNLVHDALNWLVLRVGKYLELLPASSGFSMNLAVQRLTQALTDCGFAMCFFAFDPRAKNCCPQCTYGRFDTFPLPAPISGCSDFGITTWLGEAANVLLAVPTAVYCRQCGLRGALAFRGLRRIASAHEAFHLMVRDAIVEWPDFLEGAADVFALEHIRSIPIYRNIWQQCRVDYTTTSNFNLMKAERMHAFVQATSSDFLLFVTSRLMDGATCDIEALIDRILTSSSTRGDAYTRKIADSAIIDATNLDAILA